MSVLHVNVYSLLLFITYSWDGDISDCYPEKNIVKGGKAEVYNVFFEG